MEDFKLQMLNEISSLKDGLETERKARQALEKEVNIILIFIILREGLFDLICLHKSPFGHGLLVNKEPCKSCIGV